MPGSIPGMAVQKKSVIPPSQGPLSTRTIESQNKGNAYERTGDNGNLIKPNSLGIKTVCFVNKSPQICNTVSPRAAAGANGQNIDERLKAARERREEHLKLLASRELSRLEREQRARRYYEQQLQQRKKKLLEHRLKEERRRSAVEEKRKQRLREEKERNESAVRRTLEKSQRAHLNQSQSSRGRKLTKNVPRRLPLTPWEKNLVSRLLTPTCSYLARSKSATCQSGEEVSFHSMNTTNNTPIPKKPQNYSSSVQPRSSVSPRPSVQPRSSVSPRPPVSSRPSVSSRQSVPPKQSVPPRQSISPKQSVSPRQFVPPKQPALPRSSVSPRPPVSPSASSRNINLAEFKAAKQQDAKKKSPNTRSSPKTPALNTSAKPAKATQSRTASPSPERSPRRSISRHSTPLQLELPSVPEEDVAVCSSALAPGNSRPVRTPGEGQQEKTKDGNPPGSPCLNLSDRETNAITRTEGDGTPQPPEITCRPSAGTTDPEAASRLLAEKRREARLQREREEQERLQREEAERRSREELERRRAEERARLQAEAQRLVEEKKRREEEEQRRAEEERAQAMREAALLQKQREEEQARERAKAEELKQERELLAQKEEAARQARKKRLEEIMRRTRRTDSPDTKSTPARILPNEAEPKENTQPAHNGTIEEAVKLPVGTKTSQLGLANEEDMVPVVAFKERRSLRTLAGLEEIQTHQRAEVI